MGKTDIEWTDDTWNPLRGCTEISPGCAHCYAAVIAARFSGPGKAYEGLAYFDANGRAHWTGELRIAEDKIQDPMRWKRPRQIFVNSMSDLFHENVADEFVDRVFAVMALTPRHRFQILTKRADRLQAYMESRSKSAKFWKAAVPVGYAIEWNGLSLVPFPLPNVWVGVSVENRKHGLPRIDHLRDVPAAVRFLSIEPLLEDLGEIDLTGIHWVIVGGESGHSARPMHPAWVRSIREQCKVAGVPFFFKQWGGWEPTGDDTPRGAKVAYVHRDGRIEFAMSGYDPGCPCDSIPGTAEMAMVGKAAAGRLLDGREWNEMPKGVETCRST